MKKPSLLALLLISVGATQAARAQDAAVWNADLDQLRRTAGTIPGARPLRVNVLKFAESRRTKNFSVKGAPTEPSVQARTVYQVVYPDGYVMIDSGMDQQVHKFFGRGVEEPYFPDAAKRVEQALRGAKSIVMTHEHGDHVAGVIRTPFFAELAPKTILTRTQVQTLLSEPQMPEIRLTPETAAHYIVIDYDKYFPFAPGFALVKSPGHTPGSQMIYVKLQSGREYIFAGDVAWHMDGVRLLRGKDAPWIKEDQNAMAAELKWLNMLGATEKNLFVVLSHDDEQRQQYIAGRILGDGLELFAQQAGNPRTVVLKPAAAPYIDAHVHIDQHDPEGSVQLLLQAMDSLNGAKAFIQTEPYGPGNPARWDAEMILPAVKKHSDKLLVLGGGGTLNPMILQSWLSGDYGPEVKRKFRERAEELLREGVSGFGELSTEHLSLPQSPVKDYEYSPADHPLMLLLADIAAEHNVPIDLHMEAVPKDMPMPAEYTAPNPPLLHANIAALERLLRHNPRAKIIWAHAGSDNIGFRTPELLTRLLKAHPNLYMEIKYDPNFPAKDPPIMDGMLKPAWLQLFSAFPDRFIIGSDQHYDPPSTVPLARGQQNALLTDQLPPDIKRKIGLENALRIYGVRP